MYSKLVVEILLVLAVSSAVFAASVPKKSNDEEQVGKDLTVLQKVYDDCESKDDFTGCLKGKALTALSRAVEQESISLLDGVTLVKADNDVVDDTPVIADARALSGLNGLDKALVQTLDKFLRTHTVKVDLSEARGKSKKSYRYVIAAMMTALGVAGPLGLKALAAIAGKALVISKVALTIAGIIALKKIFSSDHHEETSFQVHAGDHNRRNAFLKKGQYYVDPYRYYYEQQFQNQN
ncbi:hypothetical protein PVAND_005660 [Polypedilum vanderplanki]|uniref:Osiris 21 n=1 Tax=Polypedilum vanderplanki TaxID=319348 RepID=A0A9J6C196_POLVA|nr:hypothetical protein PVAND_005660 [Polypedilum vanderplanki]